MRTTLLSALSIAALTLGLAACGGSSDAEPGGGAGAAGAGGGGDSDGAAGMGGGAGAGDAGTTIPFACPGGTIAAGSNTLTVDGVERTFFADFPTNTTGPLGVVFSWHGYGDTATNFKAAANLDPDADPAHPVIIVTPEDTKLQPPAGLGWDIRAGKPGDGNVDLALFEATLGCLAAQQSIDATRVYSFGFSAGSVLTNLIDSRYPKLIAATVTESGAWMNDPEEAKLVKLFTIEWSWPDLDPADRGDVLLTHGGSTDQVIVLNLEDSAKAALPFLAAAERTVVECAHEQGHTLHPDLTPAMIVKYLTAHRAGEPSPYAGGTLDGFPASCTLRLP